MAKNISIADTDYGPPHPSGNHQGTIVEVDTKDLQTQHGPWEAVELCIENATVKNEEGELFRVRKYFTRSSHSKSNLRKFRETMKGAPLSDAERRDFSDAEVVGRNVGYVVVHKPNNDGDVFPSIENIWPLDGNSQSSAEADDESADGSEEPGDGDDALPF